MTQSRSIDDDYDYEAVYNYFFYFSVYDISEQRNLDNNHGTYIGW